MKSMRIILFYTLFALMPLLADAKGVSGIKILDCTVLHKGNMIDLNLELDCSRMDISANEQLEIQPVLAGENDTLRLAPLLFTGNIRDKVNHRLARFNGEVPNAYGNYNMKKLIETGDARVTYSCDIPFREWMYGSRLILENQVVGCAECQRKLTDIPIAYVPRKLAVSYIVPQPEQKLRHKDVSLYLNFLQDKSDILPEYMNNRSELVKADSLIAELTGDNSIAVDSIMIIGYASPEASFDYNTRLSGNRAESLKKYLSKKHDAEEFVMVTIAASEDWSGLRESIVNVHPPYYEELLSIIDRVSDPDERDVYIRKLDNGKTYNYLMQNLYPPLRRVVCGIYYTVEPFTTEQAKQKLATHPEQLSLNEMYLIAQSYPVGSKHFNALFSDMLTYYPDNMVAKNNLAAVALNAGDCDRAEYCLQNAGKSPEVQNNLGVLLYQQGRVNEAKQCFEMAGSCGCKEAVYNLKELNALLAIQ